MKLNHADSNLYMQQQVSEIVFLILYANDIFLICNNWYILKELVTSLTMKFAMTDIDLVVNFVRHSCGLLLHQEFYTLCTLNNFFILECQQSFILFNEGVQIQSETRISLLNSTLYKRFVRELLYLTRTRPDIAFAINQASKYMHESHKIHLVVIKAILRLFKTYSSYDIFYVNEEDDYLRMYFDVNYLRHEQTHIHYRLPIHLGILINIVKFQTKKNTHCSFQNIKR